MARKVDQIVRRGAPIQARSTADCWTDIEPDRLTIWCSRKASRAVQCMGVYLEVVQEQRNEADVGSLAWWSAPSLQAAV